MPAMLLTGRIALVTGTDSEVRDAVVTALTDQGAELVVGDGPVDVAVHVVGGEEVLVEQPIAETTAEVWATRCDRVLTDAIDAAQEAYRRMHEGGGRLLFVTPALGITGAAGLVPFASAVEGVRALAKCAARQWGSVGITVTCVAPYVGGPITAPAALEPSTPIDVAGVVVLLATDTARVVTGATVVVDGGVVMVP